MRILKGEGAVGGCKRNKGSGTRMEEGGKGGSEIEGRRNAARSEDKGSKITSSLWHAVGGAPHIVGIVCTEPLFSAERSPPNSSARRYGWRVGKRHLNSSTP